MHNRILSVFAALAFTASLAAGAGQYGYGQHDEHYNGQDRYDRQAMASLEGWAWRADNLNLSWSQRRQVNYMIRQFTRDDFNMRNNIMRTRDAYRDAMDRGQMGRAEELRNDLMRQRGQFVQRRAWEFDRLEGVLNPYQRTQFESMNGGRDNYRGYDHDRHWNEHR